MQQDVDKKSVIRFLISLKSLDQADGKMPYSSSALCQANQQASRFLGSSCREGLCVWGVKEKLVLSCSELLLPKLSSLLNWFFTSSYRVG